MIEIFEKVTIEIVVEAFKQLCNIKLEGAR